MKPYDSKGNYILQENIRKYSTKPVRAAKYSLGMKNGFMVYFSNTAMKEREAMIYEGARFFLTENGAWDYINKGNRQYINQGGEIVGIEVTYDPPKPVLYRKDDSAINKEGVHLCFGEYAFMSDESEDYEFYILEDDCWIIWDTDDSVRVWYPDSEETFFGDEKNIIYQVDGGEYIKVAV